ncbi:MAG: hypothetical protein ABID61_05390 [Candidatus Micrarchaeota archaeon]
MNIIEKLKIDKKSKIVETHISWIVIGREAYKIKKPVSFSFLDFSTVEKRKFFCEEEIRLNRRLAPEVYLDIVAITEIDGRLEIDGKGKVVDYAVKMKALNQQTRMDRLIEENQVEESDVKCIANVLADFHDKCETVYGHYGSPEIIKSQITDLRNFRDGIQKACGLGKEVDFILFKSISFIEGNKKIIEERKRSGKVKDCHGDVHSGNVFFDDGIKIIDCIEFNKDFRCIDIASDIAFMAMDLDAFGKPELSEIFVKTYIEKTGDNEQLLNLYKCYRANVRAKIATIEWLQHKNKSSEERIVKYIKLAERYAKVL